VPLVRYIGIEDVEISSVPEAVAIIRAGGTIVYPTETVYGVGCLASNESAVARINTAKKRLPTEPQIVLLTWEMLPEYIAGYENLLPLLEPFCPGALTIIAKSLAGSLPAVLAPNGNVAFRISSSWFVDEILKLARAPITSTSVNISGRAPLKNDSEILDVFWDDFDGFFLYQNDELISPPSTIVDCTNFPTEWKIVRKGDITHLAIETALKDIS
jgi:L-threonylcarbamoyladenylate synthase